MYTESQAKQERRESAEIAMERIRKQKIFLSRGLDGDDISRTSTITAGDPVSGYIGYPEVQADMIAEEKEAARKGTFLGKVERVVEGIGKLIGVPF